MGAKKYPIRLPYHAVISVTNPDRVESEVVHRNRMIACQSIAFRNQTGLRGNVEVWIRSGDTYVFIFDQTTPALNRWYWYPYTQYLKVGEQISAIQGGCVVGDILDLHIIGYTMFGEEALVE